MLKKIILLFLISISFQASLFSMCASNQAVYIDEVVNCTICSKSLNFLFNGVFGKIYECSGCKQRHILNKNEEENQLNVTSKGDNLKDQSCNSTASSLTSNNFSGNSNSIIKPENKAFTIAEIKINTLHKLVKYLATITTIYFIWKYHNQIKKFLRK